MCTEHVFKGLRMVGLFHLANSVVCERDDILSFDSMAVVIHTGKCLKCVKKNPKQNKSTFYWTRQDVEEKLNMKSHGFSLS